MNRTSEAAMSDLSPMSLKGMAVFPARRPQGREPMPEHDARRLTGADGLAHIRLGEALYTLRITRQGKLILTK